MVECWMCGKLYEPDPDKVQAWGESGEDFEPTDWQCPECDAIEDARLDEEEDSFERFLDEDRCFRCGCLPEDCECADGDCDLLTLRYEWEEQNGEG